MPPGLLSARVSRVKVTEGERFVLIDSYKRLRPLERLGHEKAQAIA
jgi:hypothetical protein